LTQGAGRIQGDQAATLEQTIDHKLANLQPSIMLYGIYNAGKSTLINALMGAEHAAVSDRPETAAIHRYDWHGYHIFDTPGVDAPAEHQQITEAHLTSVEVVLFVMSTNGAFDESSIYKRLAQVVLNQKHLIIVLNDKTGTDEQNKHAILNKVNENLLKALKKNAELMSQIPVVFLNARTALKGRLENKKLLVQKSNITQLEAVNQQRKWRKPVALTASKHWRRFAYQR
jgi:GTPase Era involved in 16S rRNA processing